MHRTFEHRHPHIATARECTGQVFDITLPGAKDHAEKVRTFGFLVALSGDLMSGKHDPVTTHMRLEAELARLRLQELRLPARPSMNHIEAGEQLHDDRPDDTRD